MYFLPGRDNTSIYHTVVHAETSRKHGQVAEVLLM